MRAFIENSWEALKVLRHELAADLRLAAEETRRWLRGAWPSKEPATITALPAARVAFQLYLTRGDERTTTSWRSG